jgi:glucosamine-6-phosphate deaminase
LCSSQVPGAGDEKGIGKNLKEEGMGEINLLSTIRGSMLEGFYPEGWDLDRIEHCCSQKPEKIKKREPFWHPDFRIVPCGGLEDFNTLMGHEIASQIKIAKEGGKEIVFILPVGPIGMYRWTVFFLTQWDIDCSHVHGFNMDEWSDNEGNTLAPSNPSAFQYAMENALYGPLGTLTVPERQRHFATKKSLPGYSDEIFKLKDRGAPLVLVYGIGRVFHIAFWEPHFAGEFSSKTEWEKQTHRIAAKLHPLTIEQNAITSFKSRTTLISTRANTIGPGLFLQADYSIGGADGILGRGMMWQGMSLCVTLKYGPDIWVPSSFMPTRPGTLFFIEDLAGPLEPELH